MIKSILILLSIQTFLFAGEQIILVVTEDFKTAKAKLACYEDSKQVFDTMEVNIGTNGLGWGLGGISLHQKSDEPLKKEGDKKAPAGIFTLSKVFGYQINRTLEMPYLYASKELICVDDVNSPFYNQLIHMPRTAPASFEFMRREDNQYELGVVVAHNKYGKKGRGSCIFMHVNKAEDASTAGCTSMSLEEIHKIVFWLDKEKRPLLIQIPKSSAGEIQKLFPELKESKLLN